MRVEAPTVSGMISGKVRGYTVAYLRGGMGKNCLEQHFFGAANFNKKFFFMYYSHNLDGLFTKNFVKQKNTTKKFVTIFVPIIFIMSGSNEISGIKLPSKLQV